jgi:GNAT superfamily N-acetyltransferase
LETAKIEVMEFTMRSGVRYAEQQQRATNAFNPSLRATPMLTFKVVLPEQISQVKKEVKTAFFSGDDAIIDAHFQDHENGESTTILGYEDGRMVGIVTIRWHSRYPLFRDRNIPLIQNIEIRYEDRGRGLGNAILERAEQEIARRSPLAGLVVGISEDYGPAQRLYVKRGYIPDGRGVCREFTPLQNGDVVTVGHDLLLWLIKYVSDLPEIHAVGNPCP